MTSIEVTAPAKVNLFLKVLNRRKSSSYHNILTLFERVSLADEVKITKIPKGIVISSDSFITQTHKENLAYKAAQAVLNYKNIKSGVKIEIKKNIPIGGGLGGGSSDAAAVLIGVNKLFNLRLGREVLMRFARRLGADVPFFILDVPFAIGKARGDRLKAIASREVFWHLLIYPGFGLSTKEIYRAFDPELIESKDLTRRLDGVKIQIPVKGPMDFSTAESMLYNDLENIVKFKKSVIGKIIKRLASTLGKKGIVSGSGPSLFCLYETRKEAERSRSRLLKFVPARERKGWQIFIVRTRT